MQPESAKKKKGAGKLFLVLASFGPCLFLIGYNIGTGSITTMAKSGADHGMKLFWILPLACLFTYVLLVAYGRYSLVTGTTSLYGIRQEIRGGWLISDFTHRPRDIRSPLFRILGLGAILFGFGMHFTERRPPAMMVFSQGFQACILPVVVVAILLLINRESLMKENLAGPG